MSKTIIAIIIIAAVAIIGGTWYLSSQPSPSSSTPDANTDIISPIPQTSGNTVSPSNAGTTTPSSANAPDTETSMPAVKEFTVTGRPFSFSPSILTVKKGDTVKITFKNAEGTHDLRIDEFNAATKKLASGTEETIQFIADKTGSFEYYCSVGTHRAMGMKGTLVVQ